MQISSNYSMNGVSYENRRRQNNSPILLVFLTLVPDPLPDLVLSLIHIQMCIRDRDEVDPRTEKARKELEERLEKRKAEKKETEERLEKQRAEKQEQEERQYNLKIDGKDVDDLTGKMVELLGTSTSIGVTENGVSAFDALAQEL